MSIPNRGWYWIRFIDESGLWKKDPPPGEDLAVLRSGIGRPAGSVPEMWRFYAATIDERWAAGHTDSWEPPPELEAEHHALTLYGVHQQSKRETPVHRRGEGLGDAMQRLRQSDKFSEEAVTRRFGAAATATSVGELAGHLRGLVSQLRALDQPVPLDYTALVNDLYRWANPALRHSVRRRWGAQFFAWTQRAEEAEPEEPGRASA